MIDLQELLFQRGLPKEAKTKLVRHQHANWDLRRLLRTGQIDIYQANQSKPVFDCDFIGSFLGEKHSHALLIGVYQVGGRRDADAAWPEGFLFPDKPRAGWHYDLHRLPAYQDLEQRVVIKWGDAALAWHQWLCEKEVIEILPAGYVGEYPGHENVILDHHELCAIIHNEPANRRWHRALSAVAGVYLITDTCTGAQYVGSAYGAGGILGRWKRYADCGHGDDQRLVDLHAADPDYAKKHFQFSILRALPPSLTRDEVLQSEILFKRKLGSRAHGLNAN